MKQVHFASSVKVDWNINTCKYLETGRTIKNEVLVKLEKQNIIDGFPTISDNLNIELKNVSFNKQKWLIKNSISPLPLHKALILLEEIKNYRDERFYNHLLLAFANSAVNSFSNLRFDPEVGVGKIKKDSPVVRPWFREVEKHVEDLNSLQKIIYREVKFYTLMQEMK